MLVAIMKNTIRVTQCAMEVAIAVATIVVIIGDMVHVITSVIKVATTIVAATQLDMRVLFALWDEIVYCIFLKIYN